MPNGGLRPYRRTKTGDRVSWAGKELKAQGVKAGIPDMFLLVPRGEYHGLVIELKVFPNRPTEKQKDWLRRFQDRGYMTAVCYGWEQAKDTTLHYLSLE